MQIHEESSCDNAAIDEILTNGKYATLALSDGNDSYVLSLFYGFKHDLETLYFKSTKDGTKFDFLKSNSYVCGTIVIDTEYSQGNGKSHLFKSVVFRGLVEVIHDSLEKMAALALIHERSSIPDSAESGMDLLIMKLQVDEITAREYPVGHN